MFSRWSGALSGTAGTLWCAVGIAAAVPCESYLIPPETHSGSGYTALQCGNDGRVYVGTAMYGGSARLVRFDPATKKWDTVFDVHSLTREPITALGAQGKLHARILVDSRGVIWAASKHGHEAFEERPEFGDPEGGYPGGHLFSYRPADGRVVDHGILARRNGLMGGAVDSARRRLYYVSDPAAHFLVYDIATGAVRDLGYTGYVPRYMALDQAGRVFLHGGMPGEPFGWRPVGASTPYLCMYDPGTDRLYQLAVKVQGPGAEQYTAPYVLVAGGGGRLFGVAPGGKYFMEFDLNSISVDSKNPMANGSINCRHLPLPFAGNQRAGVMGRDGLFYFANGKFLYRYHPAQRRLEDLGAIEAEFTPDIYPQGAAVSEDGTLYLKYLFPYRLLRFPQLTAAAGAALGAGEAAPEAKP